MLDILTITFPIFGAIALGYALARGGIFEPAEMRTLGKYVLNVALPALLFGAVGRRDLSEVLNFGYMTAFMVGGLATIALAWTLFAAQGIGPARRAIGAMGSSCPNSGFVGFPVMLMLFADKAGVILALNMMVENLVLIPVCLVLLELSREQDHPSLGRMLGSLFLSVLKRPMVIGLLAGFALMLSGLELPTAANRLLDMLAASASALALVVIGGSLVGLPLKGNTALAAQITLGKLVAHPALVAAAAFALPLIGLPAVTGDMHAALILSAAIPMFTIYPVLAQDYGHEGLASIALLGATSAAFFTLSILLSVMG
ncbi:AEC family transporter [Thalassovita sp.]|uniref:AEC family transporter n=1 Tax=Thalassovita sp. TaxID=1979401 RepID=UPI0029DE64CD|nr:AEC family transporter [Thalassovita sp.]